MYSVIAMGNILYAVSQHGYLVVFAIVLAESCGFPAPAALALVAAGAASAAHVLSPSTTIAVGLSAMMLGDILLFVAGRHTGWALLNVLCRLSMNPETCILRSAESFYKHGKVTLLFAKFVPGVNTMAPPLAGSMKMKLGQFLRLDFLGAFFYVFAYSAVGYIFRDFVVKIGHGIQGAGRALTEVFVVALIVYIVYRIVNYRRYRITDIVPRISVPELARRMLTNGGSDLLLVDVRSHGYYDSGADRIAGSIRLEPNQLDKEIESLPRDKDIFVYCT